MREIIHERLDQEESCVYLPEERSRMRYRWISSCSAETYERMLERGWRRFGLVFFRPACQRCTECRSLRLDVERLTLSRSMRRTKKRNRDLEVALRPASMSAEHLDLYHRYHADMASRRGWPERAVQPIEYYRSFVEGRQSFGHELLFFVRRRLVAVALVDLLERALSAVYCYYDPLERRRALGVYSVLCQAELARARGVRHLYLGYWIAGNASMSYKAKYRPHDILEGRPEPTDEPLWRPAG